MMNLG